MKLTTAEQREKLVNWFSGMQSTICDALEQIENEFKHPGLLPGRFNFKKWNRQDEKNPNAGGGQMGILQGAVFEKAGVNFSCVFGNLNQDFAKQIDGCEESTEFWASGISVVIHPLNPFVPTVHLNARHIVTTKSWFGGGADLTPTFEFAEDTKLFHESLRQACAAYGPQCYEKFKQQCDEYFYLPHRNEPRGVGGIFYDHINSSNFERDFDFAKAVCEAFLKSYVQIVRQRMHQKWTPEDKYHQLIKRGRYVEFNLLYDRGTDFGLKTNGNVDAVLMSLPPVASWI